MKYKKNSNAGNSQIVRLILCLCLVRPTMIVAAPMETQAFSNELATQAAGWTKFNTHIEGNNYGFSTNDLNGNPFSSGSGGGLVARGTIPNYYADVTIGGTFSRSDFISATGKMNVTAISVSPEFDGSVFVGHFSTNEVLSDHFEGHVGFNLAEQDSGTLRFRAAVSFANQPTVFYGNDVYVTFPNPTRHWSYSWEPHGGVNGMGRITATIDGPSGGTSIANIDSSVFANDFSLNAFGLSVPIAGASRDNPKSRSIYLFLDDLSYETATNGRPTLYIKLSGPGLADISWRTNYTGFILESVTNLISTNWLVVTNGVSFSPPWFNVTVPTSKADQYFRLRK